MKAVVLVPDGVSVRNFLLSPFMKLLAERAEVHVWHVIPGERLSQYACGVEAHWEPLVPYRERLLAFAMRSSLGYAHMYRGGTLAMRYNLAKPVRGGWRSRAKHRITKLAGRAAAGTAGIRLLESAHAWTAGRARETGHYRALLRRLRPSVVFSCDQRPLDIVAPVLAAREAGIPTATFIFSWDNLSSKARMPAPFDHYLVWSGAMRGELLRFYPNVSERRVHIVGTPQFDPYADANLLWSREEFFERIGADPARPLICYSGGDTVTCPEDPQHLEVLLEAVKSKQIRGEPRVLLRPAPVDDGRRYQPVVGRHPGAILAQPRWLSAGSEWTRVIPGPEDVRFLANLTRHADLNVNVASTMTLDFAIHDKPVVNIAFDVSDPPPCGLPLWDWHYRKEHYRPVVELGAARIARSRTELASEVNSALIDPESGRAARRRLVELQLGVPVGESSRSVVEALESIAG